MDKNNLFNHVNLDHSKQMGDGSGPDVIFRILAGGRGSPRKRKGSSIFR